MKVTYHLALYLYLYYILILSLERVHWPELLFKIRSWSCHSLLRTWDTSFIFFQWSLDTYMIWLSKLLKNIYNPNSTILTTPLFWLPPKYWSLLLEKNSQHSINKSNSLKLCFCTCCLVPSPSLVLRFPCFLVLFCLFVFPLLTILALIIIHKKYFYLWVPWGKRPKVF